MTKLLPLRLHTVTATTVAIYIQTENKDNANK